MSSRIDAGRIDLDLDLIDIAPIVRERAHALEGATGRLVVIDIGTGLPLVYADPDAVTTVIDHLLDNAVKYSPDGGSLALSARRDPRGDGRGRRRGGPRHRDDGRAGRALLRALLAGGELRRPPVRRFGHRPLHRAVAGRGDGRHDSVASEPGEWTVFSFTLRTSVPDGAVDEDEPERAAEDSDLGQASMIREYMRLVGVPLQHAGGQEATEHHRRPASTSRSAPCTRASAS